MDYFGHLEGNFGRSKMSTELASLAMLNDIFSVKFKHCEVLSFEGVGADDIRVAAAAVTRREADEKRWSEINGERCFAASFHPLIRLILLGENKHPCQLKRKKMTADRVK